MSEFEKIEELLLKFRLDLDSKLNYQNTVNMLFAFYILRSKKNCFIFYVLIRLSINLIFD